MDEKMFHEKMLSRAVEHSKTALEDPEKRPFGAVVIRNSDKKIVGEGCNNVLGKLDPTLHGEVVAIKQACQTVGSVDLSGCTLYSSCEPCSMCASVIWYAKIDKVYYAAQVKNLPYYFNKDKLCKELSTPIGERENYSQMMGETAEEIITKWLSMKD